VERTAVLRFLNQLLFASKIEVRSGASRFVASRSEVRALTTDEIIAQTCGEWTASLKQPR
jgi:hypothetical protein